MADCYFLGIGGTGSKCVDTYVYSCATGLGPEKLWIGMVDQDAGCGNVEKSSINIENYQRIRKILRRNVNPGILIFSWYFPLLSLTVPLKTLRNPDPERN